MSETQDQSAEELAEQWANSLGYEEVPVHESGKRCGVQWTPWMGDFFTSWSPRNSNSHAEGPWDHWVEAKIKAALLQLDRQEADLLTRLVAGALESEEARAFLGEIPTVSSLVPAERLLELERALQDPDEQGAA